MDIQQVVNAIINLDITSALMLELDLMTVDELDLVLEQLEVRDSQQFYEYHADNLGYLLIHCGYYKGKKYPVNTVELPPANSECFAECCFSQGVIYTTIDDADRQRCHITHQKEYGALTILMRLHNGETFPGIVIKKRLGIELVHLNI